MDFLDFYPKPPNRNLGGSKRRFALVEALGSWCAAVSAYDRIIRPAPGSAAERAATAELEWGALERRIARAQLDVQLEEFRSAPCLPSNEAV